MESSSVVLTVLSWNYLSNSQTGTGIGIDQAFKNDGSNLATHKSKCQRAFRCCEERAEVGASRTSSGAAHQQWEMEDVLPGLWLQTCNSLSSSRPREQIAPITASLTHQSPLDTCNGLLEWTYGSGMLLWSTGGPRIPLPICILFEPADISFYPCFRFKFCSDWVFLAANTGDWHLLSEFITKSIL